MGDPYLPRPRLAGRGFSITPLSPHPRTSLFISGLPERPEVKYEPRGCRRVHGLGPPWGQAFVATRLLSCSMSAPARHLLGFVSPLQLERCSGLPSSLPLVQGEWRPLMFSGSFSALARPAARPGGAPVCVSPHLPGARTAAALRVRRLPLARAASADGRGRPVPL